jgi:hypothetical protein
MSFDTYEHVIPGCECYLGQHLDFQEHELQHPHPHEAIPEASAQIQYSYGLRNSEKCEFFIKLKIFLVKLVVANHRHT